MAPQKPHHNGNASNLGGVRGARIQKQRKKHKLVLESAGNKGTDDKSRVVISFRAEPPAGYTFIPAGNTQLTLAMKSFAKKGNQQVMAVSASQHAQRHELSREVHRIGYHVPTEVVAQVCSHYGIRLDSAGRIVGEQDSEKLFMKISQKGHPVLNESIRDQVTINTEAKEIIRDLFPDIPDNDLFQIIKTAFQLGDNKVGTAEEIPLVRRAQLSVVAHIRHTYTEYDRLLRQLSYNEARHSVEKPTLQKLIEWRGDGNDQTAESKQAVDDAVREVVVLSDEESSDSELEEGQVIENEHLKVEPVRKQPRPANLAANRPVSPEGASSGEDAPKGYRYVAQSQKRQPALPLQTDVTSRQQQSRYALWDQVRYEHQKVMNAHAPTHLVARIPLDEYIPSTHESVQREVVYERVPVRQLFVDRAEPPQATQQPSSQSVFRGADGRLYERLAARPERSLPLQRIYTPPGRGYHAQVADRRSASPRSRQQQYHQRTPSLNDNGAVVQSIEKSEKLHETPITYHQEFGSGPTRSNINRSAYSHQNQLIDLTSSAEKATQRLRIGDSPPTSPYPMRGTYTIAPSNTSGSGVPQRRQIVELDGHTPDMVVNGGSSHAYSIRRQHDEMLPLRIPVRHVRAESPIQNHTSSREHVPGSYYTPIAKHLGYEPSDDRYFAHQSTYHTPGTPSRPMREQVYVLEDQEQRRSLQNIPVSAQPNQPSSHYIVLDHPAPNEDYQRSYEQRYQPVYRTTYVQQ